MNLTIKLILSSIILVPVVSFSETITTIIPFSPGGGADIAFRHFQKYADQKGITLVAKYKGGADGLIGMKELEFSPPDSTIGFGTVAAVAEHRKKNPSYQFEYISVVKTSVMSLVTHQTSKLKTLDELESSVKKVSSISFAYGSPSQKSSIDQLLQLANANQNTLKIPYKGSGPLVTDLIGGHVDIAFLPMSVVKTFIDEKKLILLAVTLRKPMSEFKTIPVLNKKYSNWVNTDGFCILLPQSANSETVFRWTSLVHGYINDPTVISDFTADHSESTTFGKDFMKKIVDTIVIESK